MNFHESFKKEKHDIINITTNNGLAHPNAKVEPGFRTP